MKQIQFELWKECNSKCKFCYLGKDNGFTPSTLKIHNIQKALDILSNDDLFKEYDTVAFIGGEFFQGQLQDSYVKFKFIELMKHSALLLKQNKIKNVWICATLTLGDQKDLYETLDLFKDYEDKVWILTSYDTLGRFHTKNMLENWKFHMKNLKVKYPNLNINTTIIITGDLIEKYLTNEFSFKTITNEYETALFIKLCAQQEGLYSSKKEMNDVIGNFFPKRSEFLKFLIKIKNEDPHLYDKLFNIKYRADTLYCEYQHKEVEILRDKESGLESYNPEIDFIKDCGHLSIYSCYVDSDKCALCDKEKIHNMNI